MAGRARETERLPLPLLGEGWGEGAARPHALSPSPLEVRARLAASATSRLALTPPPHDLTQHVLSSAPAARPCHRIQLMTEALVLLATSFWYGALHAIQPGHGKTIAAAYIVGARGRPVDAWILGIFVTLSHTSGIVLVGVLASLGLPGLMPQRVEIWMKIITGLLVIVIGVWALWTQRGLFAAAGWAPRRAPAGGPGSLQYQAVARRPPAADTFTCARHTP